MDGLSGPRRPQQRRAFSTFHGPLDVDGEPAEARALGALFTKLDQSLERGLTHGFHSYAGRLHPSIARGAIGRWSPPGSTVLDPFCGSGTVLVEALVAGRQGHRHRRQPAGDDDRPGAFARPHRPVAPVAGGPGPADRRELG
jgi:hypothetical protein